MHAEPSYLNAGLQLTPVVPYCCTLYVGRYLAFKTLGPPESTALVLFGARTRC